MDTAVTAGGTDVGAPNDALVGRLLDGRYRLERTIARGGMATVYYATDTRLDRVVAVKVLRAALADDPEFVERFGREARAAARLSSADVVAVFDQGRDAATGLAYLVMEHVAGRTLRDVLREHGALPAARALGILVPVLRALSAAHAAGLVHRDVKPENVLMADDGRVKVADFGLARAFETTSLTATTGVLLGTVAYLSPEQVEHGTADPRSDVYAAGIVLWELLTGVPPYSSESPLSVAYRHVNEDVPPPGSVARGVPPSVDDLVLRATRRDPAARPVDAGAFLAEVRAVLADLPAEHETVVVPRDGEAEHPTLVVPRTPSARPERPARRRRSRRGIVLAVVVALLAAAALGGGWYLGSGRWADVPDVLRSDQATATARLQAAGFDVRVDPAGRNDEQVPAGQVADQDPDPQSRVERGSVVTIVLSLGPDRRAVPELRGQSVDAARAALQGVGLRAGATTEEFSADVAKGAVVRTEPAVGEKLPPDAVVALVLSKGPELLPVPQVVGKAVADAQKALTDGGFTSTVKEVFADAAKGTVVAQDPAKGTLARGSAVALQVSKGPDLVTVPDVNGQKRADAEAALKAAGFAVRVIDVPAGPDRVLRSDPGGGAQAKRGSTITLYTF